MNEGPNLSEGGSAEVHCRNAVFICNCSCTCILRCICRADVPWDAPQTTRPLEGCTCWKLCICGRTLSFRPPDDKVVRMPREVFARWRVHWRFKMNFRNGFHFEALPDIRTCDECVFRQSLYRYFQWPRCDRCISLGTAVAVCSPLPGRGGKEKHTCFRYRTPRDDLIREWLKKARKEVRRRGAKIAKEVRWWWAAKSARGGGMK